MTQLELKLVFKDDERHHNAGVEVLEHEDHVNAHIECIGECLDIQISLSSMVL